MTKQSKSTIGVVCVLYCNGVQCLLSFWFVCLILCDVVSVCLFFVFLSRLCCLILVMCDVVKFDDRASSDVLFVLMMLKVIVIARINVHIVVQSVD